MPKWKAELLMFVLVLGSLSFGVILLDLLLKCFL